jgi:hypothetical protein
MIESSSFQMAIVRRWIDPALAHTNSQRMLSLTVARSSIDQHSAFTAARTTTNTHTFWSHRRKGRYLGSKSDDADTKIRADRAVDKSHTSAQPAAA